MQLVLTVADCPAPVPAGQGDDPRADGLPLPALSTFLARARGDVTRAPWQIRLAQLALPASLARSSPAVLAAAATGLPVGAACLAQPVWLQAAMDHLRLPASGMLRLAPDEAQSLCADFSATFVGDGLALRPLPDGTLLLTGTSADPAAIDPSRAADMRLDPVMRGRDPAVRRLNAEIELWLHDHPINRQREARRAPPVSALWLWGGGEPPSPASASAEIAPAGAIALWGEDACLAGIAALARVPLATTPADFASLPLPASGRAIVQLRVTGEGGAADGLQRFEATWLAPAIEALRARRVDEIALLMLDRRFVLTRARRWHVWRRPRTWWDTLRA